MTTLKPQSNRPLYNTVIGTLAVDGWAVTLFVIFIYLLFSHFGYYFNKRLLAYILLTFGTARRGMGGLRPRRVPSSLYQM